MSFGEENSPVNLSQIYKKELQLSSKRLRYTNTKQQLILGKKEGHVGEGISVSDQQMKTERVKKPRYGEVLGKRVSSSLSVQNGSPQETQILGLQLIILHHKNTFIKSRRNDRQVGLMIHSMNYCSAQRRSCFIILFT